MLGSGTLLLAKCVLHAKAYSFCEAFVLKYNFAVSPKDLVFHNFVEKLIHILEFKKAKGSKEMPKGDKKANCCSSNTQKSKQCNRINKVILLYFIFLKTPIIAARSIHKSIAVLSIHLFLRPGTSFRKERIENILEVTLIPAMFC